MAKLRMWLIAWSSLSQTARSTTRARSALRSAASTAKKATCSLLLDNPPLQKIDSLSSVRRAAIDATQRASGSNNNDDQMNTNLDGGLHALLLLSDSALPLGSFAFSSGLESFLAHHKYTNATPRNQAFDVFLEHSLSNVASTALPYLMSGYHSPDILNQLDNDFDASTPCTVARRASVSQGRALLTIWEKALCHSAAANPEAQHAAARTTEFANALKQAKPDLYGLSLNAHFPALFGAVCCALGLGSQEAAYLFLLNHAKAVLSAAVRASVFGPYQSQAILASARLQAWIDGLIKREGDRKTEDACVTAPAMDLWMGRHELLYSRIFNS